MAYRQIFAGLDIETTGSDIDAGHGLIQVGIKTEDQFEFVMDVNPLPCEIDPKAMTIHKIPMERIQAAPTPEVVDARLEAAFADHYGSERVRLIAVGWNVGSFDMPFIKKYLPVSFGRFSYRSVDLNSPLFTIDQARKGLKSIDRFDDIKQKSKRYAAGILAAKGVAEAWHDALYDAKAGMLAWKYIQGKMTVVD
jgi:DNA polymerase III epsilon subunit-like protein